VSTTNRVTSRHKKMNQKVYYLASPYSHKDPDVVENRYQQVEEAAAILSMRGFTLIEPIASSHHKAKKYQLPTDYEFWNNKCKSLINISHGLIVLTIDGWSESIGVTDEIKYAESRGLPILFASLDDIREHKIVVQAVDDRFFKRMCILIGRCVLIGLVLWGVVVDLGTHI